MTEHPSGTVTTLVSLQPRDARSVRTSLGGTRVVIDLGAVRAARAAGITARTLSAPAGAAAA